MGLNEDGGAGGKQAGPRWPCVGAGPSREAAVEQCPGGTGKWHTGGQAHIPTGPPGLCPVVGSGRSQAGQACMLSPSWGRAHLRCPWPRGLDAAGPCWDHRSQVLKTSLPLASTHLLGRSYHRWRHRRRRSRRSLKTFYTTPSPFPSASRREKARRESRVLMGGVCEERGGWGGGVGGA